MPAPPQSFARSLLPGLLLALLPALALGAPTRTVGVPRSLDAGVSRTTARLMSGAGGAFAPTIRFRPRPETEGPDRGELAQDAGARAVASWPPRGDAVIGRSGMMSAQQVLSPQVPTLSFEGVSFADLGDFPPDPMGAVGPTQFVLMVNGRLRTFDKATGAADGVLDLATDAFFSSVMTPVGGTVALNFTMDPQVRYDRLSGRWFLTMIDYPCHDGSCITTGPNRLLIAVSDAASAGTIAPATAWTFFQFQTDPANWLDYPSLGVDASALYVGGNLFTPSGHYVASAGYVVRKSSVLGAGPIVVTSFPEIADATTDGPFAPRGVDNFDPSSGEGYFVGVSRMSLGRLVLLRVSTPGGTPSLSGNIALAVNTTSASIPVAHLGNTGGAAGRLDAIDDRLFTAHLRNGRLWAAQNIAVNATGVAATSGAAQRDAIRWYELTGIRSGDNGGVPAVVQSGTIFDPAASAGAARQYFLPSIMVSGQGHAAIGYCTAGAPYHADAGTVGRLAGDTPGTMGTTIELTASTTSYNPPADTGVPNGRRWGDFSFTTLDPLDDMTIWTIQQYCDDADSYGCQVAELAAPPPAVPAAVPAVEAGHASVLVTLSGTANGGAGFFDPGPNLAAPARPFRHLTVTLTNAGVTGTPPTVNQATAVDPTHVQLDLNTTDASPSLTGEKYAVTVTNPDGQFATGTMLLRVDGSAAGVPPGGENRFRLEAIVPNPTTGNVRIDYMLGAGTRVRVGILDLEGREIARLVEGTRAAGRHAVAWDGTRGGKSAPPGIYFVRLRAGGQEQVRRLAITR